MDSTREAEALVLKASRTYDIPCRRDQVQAALNDPIHGPLFVKWATERLPEDFLLTVDELSLYVQTLCCPPNNSVFFTDRCL